MIEAFNQGKHDEVASLMDKVIAIIRVLVEYGGVAAGKVAMQLHGIDAGNPRQPIRSLTDKQKADVIAKMKDAGFISLS
ncbi:dihydrodipicolinate synthase [Vibrio anguillarum]|nr:dihydrodipicolinate synthase [Vibrio anguillarum]MBF4264385.1 dihydrodipicolinate synthase [Vibrio anguillarum]